MTRQFPFTDDYGYRWVDMSTFLTDEVGHCFFCNEPTHRVDIDYGAHYCGNDDEQIARELDSLEQTTTE